MLCLQLNLGSNNVCAFRSLTLPQIIGWVEDELA